MMITTTMKHARKLHAKVSGINNKVSSEMHACALHSLPELKVHEAIIGMGKLLKAIVGQVKVVDIATARGVVSCDGGAATVILQTGTVVGDMDIDRVVWLIEEPQSLRQFKSGVSGCLKHMGFSETQTQHSRLSKREKSSRRTQSEPCSDTNTFS